MFSHYYDRNSTLSNFLQMYQEKAEVFFIIKSFFFFLGIEIQVKNFLFILV